MKVELLDFVVKNSPSCVKGLCMLLKRWEEGVLPHKMDFTKISFWIQVYDLPLECINVRFGVDLGKRIGEVIEGDDGIYYSELGAYLRV